MPVVLVSGANRGLGLEFVRQYAADGWQVIAACRHPDSATELQTLAKNNTAIHPEQLDVADQTSIATLATKLKDVAIDVLLNNAGIYSGNPDDKQTGQSFGNIDSAAWAKVLHVNTIAPILMAEAFAPLVAKSDKRVIANITSKMGSITLMAPGSIAYRTSKAALNAAMRNIVPELSNQQITIVNFHPGWVKTDMGGTNADITPDVSITGIRHVIAGLTLKNSGTFFNYDGTTLPW